MVTWASRDGPLGSPSHPIPFRPEVVSHELWELDVNTEEARRLTDPDVTPFKIANGDWTVSPDGQHVAFVESRDRNIWLLTLMD